MPINISRRRNVAQPTEQYALLQQGLAALDGTLTHDLAAITLTGEALDGSDLAQFGNALDALEPIIDTLTSMLPNAAQLTAESISASQTAAAYGALLSLDPTHTANREIVMSSSKGSLHRVIGADGHARSDLTVECLDRNCGDHMITNTILYNIGLCGYNGLVGNLYPLIVMDPSMNGFRILAKLIYVHNGMTHDPSGALANFKRTNLIRAYADHTVLESDGILAIPVWNNGNKGLFVSAATIAPVSRSRKTETFQTSYLKNGVELDLIGISQTPNEVARGVADQTYALQRDISLQDALVTVGADLLNFKLTGLNRSAFTQAAQGETHDMNLVFSTTSLMIDTNTTLVDNVTAPTEAAIVAIQAAGASAFLAMEASGRVNIHTGKFRVTAISISVSKVVDANGVELASSDRMVTDLVALINGAVIEGWNVRAFMCPCNLSVECIQVLNDCYTEEHYIPHTCTLTTKRCLNHGEQTDIDDLIHLSKVKMENSAATHLLNTVADLEDLYKAARLDERPEVLGIGRLYVRPSFLKKTLDMTTVSTRRAGERREDIRAMLNDAIAEVASRLYTTADMPAARCHLRTGDTSKPIVTVTTSLHIGSYLAQSGQFSSMSDVFDVRLITSPDRRFDQNDVGKVVITFSNYASDAATEFDPLSWGAVVTAPEVVYNVNRPIGRAFVNEVLVSPRYKFINGLPVAGVITVTGLSSAALNQPSVGQIW